MSTWGLIRGSVSKDFRGARSVGILGQADSKFQLLRRKVRVQHEPRCITNSLGTRAARIGSGMGMV